jgi:hypothetical protein
LIIELPQCALKALTVATPICPSTPRLRHRE